MVIAFSPEFPDCPGSEGQLDSDTIFDGWPDGRAGSLDGLRGDFAAIARRGNRLVVARGAFGGRPLFVTRVDGSTVACSRLLPLALLRRGSLRLNVTSLVALLSPGIVPDAPLPFRDFWAVPPGSVVTLAPDGVAHRRKVSFSTAATHDESDDELARRLRDELAAAVERATRGVRKVAVLVSGGIDSSLLLATAVMREREHTGAAVLPVTMVYGGPGDDRPYMRALAEHLHVAAIETRAYEGARIAGACRIVDGQVHTTHPAEIALVALEKARAAGAQVALSGESAEWLFDASPSPLAAYVWASPVRGLRMLRTFEHMDADLMRPVASTIFRAKLPALSRLFHAARRRRPIAPPAWAGLRLRAFVRDATPADHAVTFDQRARVRASAFSPYLAQASETRARWEQLSGLRMRMPYLDPAFADFAARLPLRSLFAGGRERGLVREAMRGLVPEPVRTRMTKSRPDEANLEAYDAAGGFSSIRHLVDVYELGALGLVDRRVFRRAFERFAAHPGTAPDDWYSLWRVIAAEEYVRWLRNFDGGALACP